MHPFDSLLSEVRLTFHAATAASDSILDGSPLTVAMRAVLEYLHGHGPTTVPDIARARGVTRQHIQVLANGLLDAGLVTLVDNPTHRRSPLVAMTTAGTEEFRRVRGLEIGLRDRLVESLDVDELARAAGVLAGVRSALNEVTL